jgi:branched-subunit amino acid ABC-type transport system permease component
MSIVRLPGAGGLYFCLPPAHGLLGCVAALLDRRLASDDKRTWAIGSALAGFAGVIALLVIATLVEAIDWTINDPPF